MARQTHRCPRLQACLRGTSVFPEHPQICVGWVWAWQGAEPRGLWLSPDLTRLTPASRCSASGFPACATVPDSRTQLQCLQSRGPGRVGASQPRGSTCTPSALSAHALGGVVLLHLLPVLKGTAPPSHLTPRQGCADSQSSDTVVTWWGSRTQEPQPHQYAFL